MTQLRKIKSLNWICIVVLLMVSIHLEAQQIIDLYPVCTLSRTAMVTGQFPSAFHISDNLDANKAYLKMQNP